MAELPTWLLGDTSLAQLLNSPFINSGPVNQQTSQVQFPSNLLTQFTQEQATPVQAVQPTESSSQALDLTNNILKSFGVTAGYTPSTNTGFGASNSEDPFASMFGSATTGTQSRSAADVYYGEDSPLGQGFNWKNMYPSV